MFQRWMMMMMIVIMMRSAVCCCPNWVICSHPDWGCARECHYDQWRYLLRLPYAPFVISETTRGSTSVRATLWLTESVLKIHQ